MIDSKALEILEQWAEYTGFNPEQTQFMFGINGEGSTDYFYHHTGKRIKKVIDNYDGTGFLALLIAKNAFMNSLKEERVNVYDILTGDVDISKAQELYDTFTSEEFSSIVSGFVTMITKTIENITKTHLIGNADDITDKIIDCTDNVLDGLDKCKYDVFQKSGAPIEKITSVASEFLVYPSLSNCLMDITDKPDGMYFAFINISDSIESYFAIVVKSNGNIITISDRIDESYIGSHSKSRSGRWSEGKADKLFPYEYMFEYSKRDYKGYAHEFKFDSSKLAFSELGEEVYLPLLLAAVLVANKLMGMDISDATTQYVHALLPENANKLVAAGQVAGVLPEGENHTVECNGIVSINPDNTIVKAHESVNLDFSVDDILSGETDKEFHDKSLHYTERMSSMNSGQMFVDLWGEGFSYDISSLFSLSEHLLLHSGDDHDENDEIFVEFVGSEQRMRLQAYTEIRNQLADYIRKQMKESYDDFGGLDGIKEWYHKLAEDNMDKLERAIVRTHEEAEWGSYTTKNIGNMHEQEGNSIWVGEHDSILMNEYTDDWRKIYIKDNEFGTKCSYVFMFKPNSWQDIEDMFGVEVPKIVKGWTTSDHRRSGNSILDATDAVESVGTPFEWEESHRVQKEYGYNEDPRFKFEIIIGYSKRGYNAMKKRVMAESK